MRHASAPTASIATSTLLTRIFETIGRTVDNLRPLRLPEVIGVTASRHPAPHPRHQLNSTSASITDWFGKPFSKAPGTLAQAGDAEYKRTDQKPFFDKISPKKLSAV